MKRRDAVIALGCLAAPLRSGAQAQSAPRRIGFLNLGSPATHGHAIRAFRDELRERGHVEGGDIEVDVRLASGREDLLAPLAREIAERRPSVIVVGGAVVVDAARKAAPGVPIVTLTGEIGGAGLASKFARPDKGVTGVSFFAASLDAKRLELLSELLPKGSAVLSLADSSTRSGSNTALAEAGRALGLIMHSMEARAPDEIAIAFASARKLGVAGVNVLASPFLNSHRGQIIALAQSSRLPAIYQWPETAEEGGLMGYGPRLTNIYRQLAAYASKIVRGANPADLPIEQPTKFELVVNVKAAKTLGITFPQSILVQANKVVS